MSKHALLFLAEGFEETEAVTPLDLLRRAGVEVTAVSVTKDREVVGAHGIKLLADVTIAEASELDFHALVLPGGMPGAANLAASTELDALLKKAASESKLIAAICAAPALVLAPKGLLKDKSFTCYPGMEKNLSDTVAARRLNEKTIVDGSLITSQGVGTAISFALAIIDGLYDYDTCKKIANAVLF
jgi:4-methyl-5(b-hydroxyethyl)-thiazole monophosphate biosynthesis